MFATGADESVLGGDDEVEGLEDDAGAVLDAGGFVVGVDGEVFGEVGLAGVGLFGGWGEGDGFGVGDAAGEVEFLGDDVVEFEVQGGHDFLGGTLFRGALVLLVVVIC